MLMKFNKQKVILIAILILAGFLRLYRLGTYPPINADEAALGYNAWSLINTGKDEHGDAFPLHFKSFGDFKPGGYVYIILPFVKLLGLSEWAVRLPSALLGIITIWLVFLIAQLVFKDKILGLFWVLVLSLSPWHIHFSRGGWESNVALFLITLGVYFFFQSIKDKLVNKKFFLFSIVSFVFSLYVYHSARLIAPSLFVCLTMFNFKKLWTQQKNLYLPIFIGLALTIPVAISFLSGGASSRFSGVGLFADSGPIWRVNELLGQHENRTQSARLLHNKPIIYGIAFIDNYFSHFDGRFLFIDGDSVPRSKLPDMGQMHFFESLFLVIGLFYFLKSKNKNRYLIFVWLFISPIASALTFQAPSALRSLSLVIPLTFITAFGLRQVFLLFEKHFKKTFLFILFLSYLWAGVYWFDRYFFHYLKQFPYAWPNGFKQTITEVDERIPQSMPICVQTKHDQPYILTLFHLKYDPKLVQQEIKLTKLDEFGFSTVEHFGRFFFNNCGLMPQGGVIINDGKF